MKLAVHLHFYYLEQLSEILTYLRSLKGQCCDLFVTMVEENKKAQAQIKAVYPNATIMVVPNYGYDLGPFIEFLHRSNDATQYYRKTLFYSTGKWVRVR